MWLMHNGGMTRDQAYDSARRELYGLRHKEEVEKRVAQEEARMVGAYFGRSQLQVGRELENMEYEKWKRWAERMQAKQDAQNNSAYVSFSNENENEGTAPAAEEGIPQAE
jgi:small subunit ribosomal protein S23